jgi:isovaleryl-CoA dehydrogenase
VTEYVDALGCVIDEVVAPNAREVDEQGRFPKASIDALSAAGMLGLVGRADLGGGGEGMAAAAQVVERLARACGSTAMVVPMPYTPAAGIDTHGSDETRREIASGQHLTTLAFSEVGSRSQFWAPLGTATANGGGIRLDASKSWVTSAADADSYVWSSRPLSADGPMTLWSVGSKTPGLSQPMGFDGLGLRGNGSTPVTAKGATISPVAMLGEDGRGLDIALAVALPWFLVLSAAFSVGLMEAVTAETGRHLTSARFEHLDQSLIQQPLVRADYARMRIQVDTTRALLGDTLSALADSREDGMLRVLEVKAVAAEAAIKVTDLAMKVCGGAAFRKEVGIERHFRDARAAQVMAPTTDALLDFVGRAIGGLPLLEA